MPGCRTNKQEDTLEATHPIIQLIELTSDAIVFRVHGDVFLRNRNSSRYCQVLAGDRLRHEDMIEVRKNLFIIINFNSNSIILDPDQTSWYLIEIK